jgi:hypothetical protein
VVYVKHKVESRESWSRVWRCENPFDRQPLRVRIEALTCAGAYEDARKVTLTDFTDVKEFAERATNTGVTIDLQSNGEHVKTGKASGVLTASSEGKVAENAAWAKVRKVFNPSLSLDQREGLGLWVFGDGKDEILNVQLTSPPHVSYGIGDHYIPIDFVGWRYFELIEPEGERWSQYKWPYGGAYASFREHVDYRQVESVSLWFNNLRPGGNTLCYLSELRGLPVFPAKFKNPSLAISGREITFPVEMETGSYLEFNSATDCKLYGKSGEVLAEVKPTGDVPLVDKGLNVLSFGCQGPEGINPRMRVTTICQGDPM